MAGVGGEIEVGSVAVAIVPSARNFLSRLIKEVGPDVAAVAKTAGAEFEEGVAKGASEGVKKGLKDGDKEAAKKGKDAGVKFSGGFAVAVKAGMAAVQNSLGSISIKAQAKMDTSEARAEIIDLKRDIATFRSKTIDINLDADQFFTEAAAIKATLASLSGDQGIELGELSEIRNASRAIDNMVDRLRTSTTQTGAFARKVDDYFKQIDSTLTQTDFDITPHLDDDEIVAGVKEVEKLRASVARFRDENARGLLSGDEVYGQINDIVQQLKGLENVRLNPRLAYEVSKVREQTDAFLEDLTGKKETVKVEADTKPAKAELEGFAREVKRVAETAEKAITIRADLDGDEVYPELAKIKATLRDIVARIGVDLDDAEAIAQIRILKTLLDDIQHKRTANIGVSQDFLATNQALGKFLTDLDGGGQKLDGFARKLRNIAQNASAQITIRPELQDDEVYQRIAVLKASLARIVARVGIDGDTEVLARLRLVAAEAKELTKKKSVSVDVDRDVFNLSTVFDQARSSIGGASSAIERLKASFQNMTPAALVANAQVIGFAIGLPAAVALASFALTGLAGLIVFVGAVAGIAALGVGVLALALAKVTAAIKAREEATKQAAVTAAQAAQTEFSNAQAIASADDAIASAEKSLARARSAASRQGVQAARALAGAQRNLVQANQKERDARTKLSQAYKDAKTDLAKLNEEIRKNRIEQQAQAVSVLKARDALNAAYADPTSSSVDILAAQAGYNAEEQKLRDLRAEQAKNQAEKDRYDKLGLAANAQVIAAQAAVKAAVESVRDAQDSVATAAENAAQQQIAAAQSVNDAEEALAKARQSRADTLKQQQLAAATVAATQATKDQPENDLTDKGKSFVDFYESKIKPFLDDLFRTAQDSGVLDGIVGFFQALTPVMEPLKGLIKEVGFQAGTFLLKIGEFLGSDEGKKFIGFLTDMAKTLGPIMSSLAESGLSIIFTLFEALAPVLKEMGPQIAQMAQDFAEMFKEFVKSDDFQQFIKQMIANGPRLLVLFFEFLGAVIDVLNALGPVGAALALVFRLVFYIVDKLNPGVLSFLLFGIIGLITYLFVHWSAIWANIKEMFLKFVDWFVQGWKDCLNDAGETLSGWGDAIANFWDDWIKKPILRFVSWFTDGWKKCFDDAKSTLSSWGEGISKWWTSFVGRLGKIWQGIKDFFADPLTVVVGFVNDYLIDPFNTVSKVVNGPQIDRIKPPPAPTHAATGAIIPGYQSSKRDEVPAMLRKGEGVLVPEVVRALGPQTILEWNRRANLGQKFRHFAYGGLVDQIVAFERKSGVPFNVTSGVRNSNDYHGRGMAVDTASTPENMVRLASWLYGYSPYLLELIHSGGQGYFVKNGSKVGANYYRSVVAQHYNHVHTALNKAGLLAVQEGADPAEGTTEEPTGLAATLIGRLNAAVKTGIGKALGKQKDSTLGKIAIGMSDLLVGKMGTVLIEKAAALAGVVTDVVGDVGSFLKDLFTGNKDEKGKFAHAKGIEASPILAAGYAKSLLGQFGWNAGHMESLAKLWNGESGWRFNARNRSSGAYGIPQALPATKMASVGSDWAINAFTQVLWGMGYIQDRYGNPTNAYQTWLSRAGSKYGKWYDTGGYLPPGLTLAYNGTGRHERVMTHEQEQAMLKERAMLLRGRADVNIRVHDGAVTGLVSAEVDRQFGMLADDFVYGGAQ